MALAGRRFGCGEGISGAVPLIVVAPHTLVSAAKSSGKRAILWLIRPPKVSSGRNLTFGSCAGNSGNRLKLADQCRAHAS
jgi:hypothetical protein